MAYRSSRSRGGGYSRSGYSRRSTATRARRSPRRSGSRRGISGGVMKLVIEHVAAPASRSIIPPKPEGHGKAKL